MDRFTVPCVTLPCEQFCCEGWDPSFCKHWHPNKEVFLMLKKKESILLVWIFSIYVVFYWHCPTEVVLFFCAFVFPDLLFRHSANTGQTFPEAVREHKLQPFQKEINIWEHIFYRQVIFAHLVLEITAILRPTVLQAKAALLWELYSSRSFVEMMTFSICSLGCKCFKLCCRTGEIELACREAAAA